MKTLLVRLAGPLQAWGAASRFARRDTRQEPTKSAVIGLLAAAQGRRRSESIEDLARLSFGVRVDQPGRLLRDFQVAVRPTGQAMPVSNRFYLADAVFVAAVQGPEEVIDGLVDSIRAPMFPLYLGRRSCPPSRPLLVNTVDLPVDQALTTCPWEAAAWYRRRQARTLLIRAILDAPPGAAGDYVRDQPVSFDPELRLYDWRAVVERWIRIDNPVGVDRHDSMAAVGGA